MEIAFNKWQVRNIDLEGVVNARLCIQKCMGTASNSLPVEAKADLNSAADAESNGEIPKRG
jgi:hypothetical protein